MDSASASKNSAGYAGAHVHALPDDLLLRILKQPVFKSTERYHTLPMVCTRWSKVVPKSVKTAKGRACSTDCSDDLLALYTWLAKHAAAGSLRDLEIEIQPHFDGGILQQRATRALLEHSLLPACTGLHKLDLSLDEFHDIPFGLEAWAASLPNLRSLTFHNTGHTPVTGRLHGLTNLQELSLSGGDLRFSEEATLPSSLTCVTLKGAQGEHLPAQLSALTALQALHLAFLPTPAAGFGVLTTLPALKQLKITDSTHLPSCLSALTRLSSLHMCCTPLHHNNPSVVLTAQEEAVEDLPNLVHLTLSVPRGRQTDRVPRMPNVLAHLPELQSLRWDAPPADDPALPPGPYLASLTRLEMHTSAVVANLGLLSEQAGKLAELTLLQDSPHRPGNAEGRVAVASWVTGHAPLHRLRIVSAECAGALETACQQAQQGKPSLQVEFPKDNA